MKTYKNISEYIAHAPKPTQAKLREMYTIIKKLVPQGQEGIRYGMPTIMIHGKNLVHFAAMKGHLGFYPAPSGVKFLEQELKKHSISYSKGCIRFLYETSIPRSLVTRIIAFRVKEEDAKNMFAGISAPAHRALTHIGITTLKQLTRYTEDEIKKLHGMGPHALRILKKELQKNKLSFKQYSNAKK